MRVLPQSKAAVVAPELASRAPLRLSSAPAARPQISTESLGTQMINGIAAEGRRTTRTIEAGTEGNDRPIVVTTETWNSPELKIMLLSTMHDPRSGDNTTKLENFSTAEPDPALFQVPADYEVVDETGPVKIRSTLP